MRNRRELERFAESAFVRPRQALKSRMRPPTHGQGVLTPAWAAGNDLAWDFVKGSNYFGASDPVDTHAAAIYAPNAAGIYTSFAVNTLVRTDLGLQCVPTRTNVCLHNRDLTNAAWVAVNMTAAKDQVGIDAVAASASKITAGDANATILQTITLASSARAQSAFVKRVTGSGVVEMTMDNGTTWTGVTVTAAWTRVTIPTQTLANPVVGFRIVTSGDAIAVDFVQNENGTFATSPIPVTTVAVTVTGNQQLVTLTGLLGGGFSGLMQLDIAGFASSGNQRILYVSDGTTANVVQLNLPGTSLNIIADAVSVGQGNITIDASPDLGTQTIAFSCGTNYMMARKVGNSAPSADTSITYPALDRFGIGSRGFSAADNSYIVVKKLALKFGAQDATTFAAAFEKAQLADAV